MRRSARAVERWQLSTGFGVSCGAQHRAKLAVALSRCCHRVQFWVQQSAGVRSDIGLNWRFVGAPTRTRT